MSEYILYGIIHEVQNTFNDEDRRDDLPFHVDMDKFGDTKITENEDNTREVIVRLNLSLLKKLYSGSCENVVFNCSLNLTIILKMMEVFL